MKKHLDYFLFSLVCGLLVFSAIFFYCLSAPASWQRFGNANHFFLHQLILGFIPAIMAGIIAYKVPIHFFKKWSLVFVIANIVAMFLVFLPFIGVTAGGATRWIKVFGTTIQPSEFLKITSILYLSAWIASKLSDEHVSGWKLRAKKGYHNTIYIFLPFLVFLGIIAIALFLQSDISTLGIISLTLLMLYFCAKTPLWQTMLVVLGGLGSLFLMVRFEPYRLARWLTFLNPGRDPLGSDLQVTQSIISLGSGGFFGRGLGLSSQKFGALPQAMTDSIFAIIGEELGMIGCVAVIAAFIAILWTGVKIYKQSGDKFSRLTAIGIVVFISLQAFINIASAVGWFPLAGIPLPFFSSGGSHLMVEMIGMGILLNISKNT